MARPTLFIAALAAVTLSIPASAADAIPVTVVDYSDLNLATPDGAQALKDRVARVAKQVCSVEGDKSLANAMQARSCAQIAVARAMPQVELALANAVTRYAGTGRIAVAAN